MRAVHLNNLKIRHKLILLLFFPVGVLVLFTGYGTMEKWRQYSDAKTIQTAYEYVLGLSDVIHALQKERSLSAGYLNSDGKVFKAELDRQWLLTDERINTLQTYHVVRVLTSRDHASLRGDLIELSKLLQTRYEWRRAIDEQLAKDAIAGYSALIVDAIYLIRSIGPKMDDAVLVRNNQAYDVLLWIQEYAARERGMVNGLLVKSQTDSRTIAQVSAMAAKQDSLLDEYFRINPFPDENQIMGEALLQDSPVFAQVDSMRQAIQSRIEKLELLDQLSILMGYGGLIHQFKNYVLRGDADRKASVFYTYQQAFDLLNQFRSIPQTTPMEIAALNRIESTLDQYEERLNLVGRMRLQGASVADIDEAVRIDDRAALSAIDFLRGGIQTVALDDWFRAATHRIDLFKALSDELRRESIRFAVEKTQRMLFVLSGYVFITLVALLCSLFFVVSISRRLVMGISDITNALRRVEESGDFSGHITIQGNDEIAAMGRSFNSLINERQSAENRLRLSARVFESTIDGIMITDAEQKIMTINPAFSTITGYSESEVVGRRPRVLSSNRHDHSFFQLMWKQIKEKGCWQGEIWNRRKCGEVYPQWENISAVKDNLGRVVNYICVFSDISKIKHSQQQMEYLAHHDSLTGLPNRALLDQHLTQGLERAWRQHDVMAVLFLDLDRFKNINDSLGHPSGDALLKLVAKRLKRLIRAEDLVARLGGDEFAIVLESPSDGQCVARVAQKCIEAFKHPFNIEGTDVFTSTSIGISLYPDDGEQVDLLLKHADTAMYYAKEQGRNNYCFYDRQMTAQAVERLALENQLRRALAQQQLVLQYQPQVSLKTGEITGVEALIRWRQPDGSYISPTLFISVAEESGLIEEIDRWVLHEACKQAVRWQSAGLPPISMAVNISGFSMEHGMLLEMVENALHHSQVDPRLLELEITEGFLMQHSEQAAMIIRELRAQGVSFSIDDFGTGYSSLGYLKNLPINRLKIDRSFVQDIPDDENDMAITQAVIALGHSMNMGVVAEGVEMESQARYLTGLACDYAQGFMYGRSVDAHEIEAMVTRSVRNPEPAVTDA